MTGLTVSVVRVPPALRPSAELNVVLRGIRSSFLAFLIHFLLSTLRKMLVGLFRGRRSGVFTKAYVRQATRLAGRWAAFLGGLTLMRALAGLLLRKTTNWSGNAVEFWSGMIAGQSVNFLPTSSRMDVSMYCFVRACYTLLRLLINPPAPLLPSSVPAVKTPTASLMSPVTLVVPIPTHTQHLQPILAPRMPNEDLCPKLTLRAARRQAVAVVSDSNGNGSAHHTNGNGVAHPQRTYAVGAASAAAALPPLPQDSPPALASPPAMMETPLSSPTGLHGIGGSTDSLASDIRPPHVLGDGLSDVQSEGSPPAAAVAHGKTKRESFIISAAKTLSREYVESPSIEVEGPPAAEDGKEGASEVEGGGRRSGGSSTGGDVPLSPLTWGPNSPSAREVTHPIHPPPSRLPWWVGTGLKYVCPSTVVMGLCACQLFWGLIFGHKTLSPTYFDFLVRFGGKSKEAYNGVAHFCLHKTFTPELIAYAKALNLPSPSAWHGRSELLLINYISRGRSPFQHWLRFVVWNFMHQCAPLYLPLKVVLVLLFSASKTFQHPGKAAKDIILSTIRSSLFLSVYCANAWLAVCFLLQKGIIRQVLMPVAAGLLAGLATLIEAPSRRRELALYCCVQAIPSFFIAITNYFKIPRPPRLESLAFSVGISIYLTAACNPWHAGGVDPWMRRALEYLVGVKANIYPLDSPRMAQRTRTLMRTVQRSPPFIAVAPPTPTRAPNVTRYAPSPLTVMGGNTPVAHQHAVHGGSGHHE